ncbi:hypothetical protein BACCIP111883_01691 [Sutcliffiella rhizosphaerae]|uniref:Uncharacterized protein n=1 Tax=Sutcliffiella rhizosphaerae TaxID=2880967 RepID=A0ABM8YLX1_9BACI|nr:hypothetical protein BACCIP111883_01691 [Sutcliffiella rhizosphaerae]
MDWAFEGCGRIKANIQTLFISFYTNKCEVMKKYYSFENVKTTTFEKITKLLNGEQINALPYTNDDVLPGQLHLKLRGLIQNQK